MFFYLDVWILPNHSQFCCVQSGGLTKQMMKLPEEREGKDVESKYGLVAA